MIWTPVDKRIGFAPETSLQPGGKGRIHTWVRAEKTGIILLCYQRIREFAPCNIVPSSKPLDGVK